MMAVPAPTVQVGDANSPAGEELSVHETSVVNPVAEPVTAVPTGPELGVRVSVPNGPTLTVNVALAVSAEFDWAVTA